MRPHLLDGLPRRLSRGTLLRRLPSASGTSDDCAAALPPIDLCMPVSSNASWPPSDPVTMQRARCCCGQQHRHASRHVAGLNAKHRKIAPSCHARVCMNATCVSSILLCTVLTTFSCKCSRGQSRGLQVASQRPSVSAPPEPDHERSSDCRCTRCLDVSWPAVRGVAACELLFSAAASVWGSALTASLRLPAQQRQPAAGRDAAFRFLSSCSKSHDASCGAVTLPPHVCIASHPASPDLPSGGQPSLPFMWKIIEDIDMAAHAKLFRTPAVVPSKERRVLVGPGHALCRILCFWM